MFRDTPSFRPRTLCRLATDISNRATSSACAGGGSVDRSQEAPTVYHVPVFERQITAALSVQRAGVVIDGTLGGGGHTAALLRAAPHLRVLGLDRDPEARAAAADALLEFGDRVKIVAATFGEISTVVREHADFLGGDDIVGVLLDLGVSSHQLDDASRGFSFRQNAPLDMRMDASKGSDATSYLRSVSEHDLVHLLRENGEQRFASAIARSLMALQPSTTDELTAAVEKAVPAAARRRGHVATRVFQALRIAVNDEVEELAAVLPAALGVLSTGGKLVVISYHSGEDRAVKHFFAEEAKGGCQCPVHLPCVCGATPRVTLAKASAIMPTEEEVLENPRARSARLRMATKVA